MPFSHDAFLDVFGGFNTRLWPAGLALWLATAVVLFRWIGARRLDERVVFGLLAAHWAWSGIAYHWLHFRAINPAASIFAAAFVVQAALFAWRAGGPPVRVLPPAGARGVAGAALALYGLVYPGLGLLFGLTYPRLPLFGVPCPTTIVTAGLLVGAVRAPRALVVIPLLWSVIGSTAAFALGITADLALVAAGAMLALELAWPSVMGRQS